MLTAAVIGVMMSAVLLVPAAAVAATPYPLDHIERFIARRGKVRCPKVPKVWHRGTHVRYHSRVRVYRGFKPRLVAFEKMVAEVGKEIYGWAPRRIRHIGTYNCRRIAAWPDLLSEHGLANGIDISAFVFGRPPRRIRRQVPRHLRRGFKVSVLRHWRSEKKRDALHRRFLRTLVQRLVDQDDRIFRVLVGPGYPGHDNHFHFDVAPWALIHFDPMPKNVGSDRAGLSSSGATAP